MISHCHKKLFNTSLVFFDKSKPFRFSRASFSAISGRFRLRPPPRPSKFPGFPPVATHVTMPAEAASLSHWRQTRFTWNGLNKLLYFEWSPPWHVGWRLSGEGCHWEYDGKNGEFENIDFRFPWLSDTSEMGFGHDVPFLNYSDRLPHPSDLCQPDRVRWQLISWNVFRYSQLRRLTGSNLLTFFLTYLLTFFLTHVLIYSSDISSDILSDISSDILSDIFLTYLLTFFLTDLLTYLLTFFLTNLLTLFLTYLLTYLSTCFLTYLLTFFLTYQNQNLSSTASHKKPLCKLYIYLTPRSKSNIHDNFVPVNVIALSASDRPAKRQLSPKMQNACSSTHTPHASDRPAKQQLSPNMQKGLRCHDYISWRVQTMKPDACHCGSFTSSA